MKKPLKTLIIITAVFFVLLAGLFIGRNSTKSYKPVEQALNTEIKGTTSSSQNKDGKIDINTATVDQLQMLPGIGEVLAQRIIDYREEHGAFQSIEELLNVSGIGESKLANIEPRIKVVLNSDPT